MLIKGVRKRYNHPVSSCPTCGGVGHVRLRHGRAVVRGTGAAGSRFKSHREWSRSHLGGVRPIRVSWPQGKDRRGRYAACPDAWHRRYRRTNPSEFVSPILPIDEPLKAEFEIRRTKKARRTREMQGKDRR